MSLRRLKQLLPPVVALIALSGSTPWGAMAATQAPAPNHDLAHPRVMQQAAHSVAAADVGALAPFTAPPKLPAVGGAGGPLREVFGFALASSLSDPIVGYPTWDFSLLSTVAFFGLHVQNNGTFAADTGWRVWNTSQLGGVLRTAQSRGRTCVPTIVLPGCLTGS